MRLFDLPIQDLVLTTGFAAINYGMRDEVKVILSSLYDWGNDLEKITLSESIFLFGLGEYKKSLEILGTIQLTKEYDFFVDLLKEKLMEM
jgi:hypothetical protein